MALERPPPFLAMWVSSWACSQTPDCLVSRLRCSRLERAEGESTPSSGRQHITVAVPAQLLVCSRTSSCTPNLVGDPRTCRASGKTTGSMTSSPPAEPLGPVQ